MAFFLFTVPVPYKFGLGRLTDEIKICAIILKAFFSGKLLKHKFIPSMHSLNNFFALKGSRHACLKLLNRLQQF